MSTTGLAKYFEDFVKNLLTRSGISLTATKDDGFDFLGVSKAGASAAIEVKLYSSASVSPALLQRAAAMVAYSAQQKGIAKAILVTNTMVPAGILQELLKLHRVIVYDYEVITALASEHIDLAAEWERIVGLTRVFRSDYSARVKSASQDVDPIRDINEPSPVQFGQATQIQPPPNKGKSLADEIEKIPSGKNKKAATKFEKKCTEALKYIFSDDLSAWLEQPTSDSGLNRYDLIARISSEEDFWQCLARDFRARYVIFEFKNYGEKITQKEIFTTEKYLYPSAMRAAAIIISRQGANENAKSAARGALREAGKLIINLSIADLRSMLEMRDRGESGAEVLLICLDQMLIRIER